jgi:hypothetical protein
MRSPSSEHVEWHVHREDDRVPEAVADAAARGVPIVAHVPRDAPLDGWMAELLEECAAVIRYGT